MVNKNRDESNLVVGCAELTLKVQGCRAKQLSPYMEMYSWSTKWGTCC